MKTSPGSDDAIEVKAPAYACSHCSDCGYNNFPSADVCPKCWSTSTQLLDLSAHGTLYSFTTMGSADAVKFVGLVDLPESVRVFGQLETPVQPVCGAPVTLSRVRAPGYGPCYVYDLSTTQGA